MSVLKSINYLKALNSLSKPYMYKSAAQPPMGPPPGGDPSMGGGMPPMDPSMMGGMPPGGMPPMDPSMMGGAPPMDPSMMGGMPPMDPSMMGGMPPMDPSMMGGMPPAAPPAAPAAPGAPAPGTPAEAEQKVTNKIKTEQWMQHIDSYNYNLLKLMINLYEHLGIPVPAESLLPQPLGSNSPSAGDISGMMGAAADATSPQTPIDAMTNGDAAPPDAAGGAAPPPMDGGGVKQSSWTAPYHRQVGVRPARPSIKELVKKASMFKQPTPYASIMAKMNRLNGFN